MSTREPGTINKEFSCCPFMNTVGKWRQETTHSTVNVTKQRQVQRQDTRIFGLGILPDKLYAAYASYREELGGRDYWLLRTLEGPAVQLKKAVKVPGGTTISAKTWVVKAQWYLSSSDDQRVKSYKLLPERLYTSLCAL